MLKTWRGCQGLTANIALGLKKRSSWFVEKTQPTIAEMINTPGREVAALRIREIFVQMRDALAAV